jgi:hypothetical protein
MSSLFLCRCSYLTGGTCLHCLLRGYFLYVYDVRTSQETHAFTVCYGILFICRWCSYLTGDTCFHCLLRGYFLYVADVHTSQETHVFTACFGDRFTYLQVDDVRTSPEAQAFTACCGDSFICPHVDYVRTSQERHLYALTASYGDTFTFYIRWCSYHTRYVNTGLHGLRYGQRCIFHL